MAKMCAYTYINLQVLKFNKNNCMIIVTNVANICAHTGCVSSRRPVQIVLQSNLRVSVHAYSRPPYRAYL